MARTVLEGRQILLFCLLLLWPPLQVLSEDCPLLTESDLEGSSGLINSSLSSISQCVTVASLELTNYSIVCLAQGSRIDRYRMVSVIATYRLNGLNETLNQFHFQCVSEAWSAAVSNGSDVSVATPPIVGNLSTPLRRDCWLCGEFAPYSAAEHCAGE